MINHNNNKTVRNYNKNNINNINLRIHYAKLMVNSAKLYNKI